MLKYSKADKVFEEKWVKIISLFTENKLEEVIAAYASEVGETKFNKKKHHVHMSLALKYCRNCNVHYLSITVLQWDGKNAWINMDGMNVHGFSDYDLSLP